MYRPGIEPRPTGREVAIVTPRPLRLVDVGSELNVHNKLQGQFPIVINEGFWSRKSIQGKNESSRLISYATEARKVKQGEKMPFLFRFL